MILWNLGGQRNLERFVLARFYGLKDTNMDDSLLMCLEITLVGYWFGRWPQRWRWKGWRHYLTSTVKKQCPHWWGQHHCCFQWKVNYQQLNRHGLLNCSDIRPPGCWRRPWQQCWKLSYLGAVHMLESNTGKRSNSTNIKRIHGFT